MLSKKGLMGVLLFTIWCGCAAATPSTDGHSPCSAAIAKSVGAYFKLTNFTYPEHGMYPSAENRIVASACKLWPYDSSKTIAAFAYDADVEYEKALFVVVVDSNSNSVIASFKGAIPEDSASEVRADSLWIDTARYNLSNATRSFGIATTTFRDRCTYEGGYDFQETLFVVEGKGVRPVFSEVMSHWSYEAGDRCSTKADFARTDAAITIAIEKTMSNGFADLRLTAKRDGKARPLSLVVKYDGRNYDLNAWKKAFDVWWFK
nr:hypothetical protein [Rhodoferax sp.]